MAASSDLVKVNTTITFGKTCVETSQPSLTLEVNSEDNNDSSSFAPGDTVYIRCYPGGFSPEYSTSAGTLRVVSVNVYETIKDEYMVFARASTINTSKPIKSIESIICEGRQAPYGFHQVDLTTIMVSGVDIWSGVAKISYTSFYDKLALICNSPWKVLVEAYIEDPSYLNPDWIDPMYASTEVDFTEGETTSREVWLTVKDACTKGTVAGASVYIDDRFVGLSDEDGRILVGTLVRGKRYKLLVTCDGYQPTDEDRIENDFIDLEA